MPEIVSEGPVYVYRCICPYCFCKVQFVPKEIIWSAALGNLKCPCSTNKTFIVIKGYRIAMRTLELHDLEKETVKAYKPNEAVLNVY